MNIQIPVMPPVEQQTEQIKAIVDNFDTMNGFVELDKSTRIAQRGKQAFAIFGGTAYDITPMDFTDPERGRFVRVPALLSGHAYAEFPDEGNSGVLFWWWSEHLEKRLGKKEWHLGFQSAGWLHEKELELSSDEITMNIIEDILRGETPLTGGGLPGWI